MASKKFVIKPYKQHQQWDRVKAQSIWEELNGAIDEIFKKNASNLSFEHLYRNAYNLVLHKHAELLYQGVQDSVQTYLTGISSIVATTPDDQLLQELSERWKDHQITMSMIRDILMYMDRTFIPQHNKTKVYDLGLQLFRDIITRHSQVRGRLRHLLLENIRKEREGQLLDRDLMKSTLSMLEDLGIEGTAVYEEDFEAPFLEQTKQFYRLESQDYITKNTCPDYMRKAEARLVEEHQRVNHYLSLSTEPKLRAIVEEELVRRHAATLVEMENSGCKSMLREDKIEDLKRMYRLFSRVPTTLDGLRICLADYIKALGKALLAQQEKEREPVVFVKGLLLMRDKFDRIVAEAFNSEKSFQKKLQESFEDFINTDSVKCANYLALYVDDLLKNGLKGMTEEESDLQLSKFITIFKYLQDKDIFENYYKQHLSRRLLSGKSANDDFERAMIVKLKSECGYHFTSKLEGMFNDMKLSKDAMEEYRRNRRNRVGGIDLEVHMLTMGNWPTTNTAPCLLPPQVSQCCAAFEEFYLKRHTGRKVAWQTSMGSAELRANFSGRRHELVVPTYAMCILMHFNSADTLTLEELQKATHIPPVDLRRNLISLCAPKYRILKKLSKSRVITESDSFTFNADFTCKLRRLKIPLVSMKEVENSCEAGAVSVTLAASAAAGFNKGAPSSGIPAAVMEDRRHLVEAAIVRIMKARKVFQHNDLIAEVTRQLSIRFNAQPMFIKQRIESLIERDYLERDKADRRMYKYLA